MACDLGGSGEVIQIACYGICSGIINITPTGGTPLYTYLWTDGNTDQNRTGLCPGVYSVTITDSMDCTCVVGPITINEGVHIIGEISLNCTTGTLTVTPSGGTIYSYQWQKSIDGGSTYNDIGEATLASYATVLEGEYYRVIISDATSGCEGMVTYRVPGCYKSRAIIF